MVITETAKCPNCGAPLLVTHLTEACSSCDYWKRENIDFTVEASVNGRTRYFMSRGTP